MRRCIYARLPHRLDPARLASDLERRHLPVVQVVDGALCRLLHVQDEAVDAAHEVVVRDALQALAKNQSTVVPGDIRNQLVANAHRFLPREALTNLWKTILGTGLGKN